MANVSKEELLKIAQMSSLTLTESEIVWMQDQLSKTVEYTNQLNQVVLEEEHETVKTINVFREDKAIKKDASKIRAQAPKITKNHFVVPKILD
jgi:aspartyl/glutamyl-tRNA(Asn/Gln) amidotransferase C subunit